MICTLLQYNNVAIKQNRENETQVQKKMCDFNKNTCYTQASANSNTCQRVQNEDFAILCDIKTAFNEHGMSTVDISTILWKKLQKWFEKYFF